MNNNKDYKIGIFGLSNAGKTSIIKALMREYEVISTLKPTRGRERTEFEFLGKKIFFWDFGGQERYRAKYLNNPVHFFDSFSYVYYVVDIQDTEQLDINVLYFKLLMKEIKTYSPGAKHILLYHKADPEILKEKKGDIRQDFFDQINGFVERENVALDIFQTTIYDPFSIVVAFSKPFLEEKGIYGNVSDALEAFGKKLNLDFGIVFTRTFFEIGHYRHEEFSENVFISVVKTFLEEYDESTTEPDLIIGEEEAQVIVKKFIINYGRTELVFYIVIGYMKEKTIDKENIKKLTEELSEDLIKLFMSADLTDFIPDKDESVIL